MQTITFSQQFFDLIKKLTNVSKPKATLFFARDGRFHINIPTTATFLHISAGPGDFSFDGSEVNVALMMEFIKFTELVGYPERGSITVDDEMLTNGHTYTMIKFQNGTEKTSTKTARCICADPTLFNANARKVPAGRDTDKMNLLGTVAFSAQEVKSFCNEIKLVPGCQFVTVVINDKKLRFFMKGKTGQQITNDVDHKCIRLGSPENIALSYDENGKPSFRKFPAIYFNVLRGVETDYEMEVRHIKGGPMNKMMLKSFANIPGADPNDPIRLYVGSIECDGAEINAEALVL